MDIAFLAIPPNSSRHSSLGQLLSLNPAGVWVGMRAPMLRGPYGEVSPSGKFPRFASFALGLAEDCMCTVTES